jgi:ectoine hydroxylase-related dioxygenase (phytanoyl-CoA dioxygenase family)
MLVTSDHVEQYREQGYFILESAMSAEQLVGLRSECQRFIDAMHAEMDAKGVDTLGISHRNKRYFISKHHTESQILTNFLFGDLVAEITHAVLGDNVYLFLEQYVVKAAEIGMKFGWHQDSGYIGYPHKPYLTCWCPLDDVTEENGTVYILPYDRAGTKELIKHVKEEGTNDLIGYFGDDPGVPVIVPAGSIAAFSSFTLHRSGFNTTNKMRRVYLAQYSADPILNEEKTALRQLAKPFFENGKRVAGVNATAG